MKPLTNLFALALLVFLMFIVYPMLMGYELIFKEPGERELF